WEPQCLTEEPRAEEDRVRPRRAGDRYREERRARPDGETRGAAPEAADEVTLRPRLLRARNAFWEKADQIAPPEQAQAVLERGRDAPEAPVGPPHPRQAIDKAVVEHAQRSRRRVPQLEGHAEHEGVDRDRACMVRSDHGGPRGGHVLDAAHGDP